MSRSSVAVSRSGTKLSKEYQDVIRKSFCHNGLRRCLCPWVTNEDLEKLYQNGLFEDQGDPKRPPILEDLRRRDLT